MRGSISSLSRTPCCFSVKEFCNCITCLGRWQITWLVIILSIFTGIGTANFLKANGNEKRQWKPERKIYELDYATVPSLNYWMPSVKISAQVMVVSTESYNFSDFISGLYVKSGLNVTSNDPGMEVNVELLHQSVQDLDVYEEGLKTCNFNFVISSSDKFDVIVFESWDWIYEDDYGLTVPVGYLPTVLTLEIGRSTAWKNRNDTQFDSPSLEFLGPQCFFTITYTESVIHKIDGSEDSRFSTSLVSDRCTEYKPYIAMITLKTDLLIDHWEEYVEYGYLDWFVGMCGLVDFMIIAFFVVAERCWILVWEEELTGILASISRYHTLEKTVKYLDSLTMNGYVPLKSADAGEN